VPEEPIVPQPPLPETPAKGKAVPGATTKGKATAPAGQSGEENAEGLQPAPSPDGSGAIRREVRRPTYSAQEMRAARRNVLVGRVESEAGEPLGEVPVSVSSRANSSIHHDGLTNAFGGFAIRLTDGEWIVKVTKPSGRVYPVRQISVSSGKITDLQEGREVYNLIVSF
jgi:hypothetical protein